MNLCQPASWTIAGCSVFLVILVIWDEIRTESRFRAWQLHEDSTAQKHKEEKKIQ